MYRYFVSYSFLDSGNLGFANCEVERNAPIISIKDTMQIAAELFEKVGETVVILNFILLNP